jgi:hypothetical protein
MIVQNFSFQFMHLTFLRCFQGASGCLVFSFSENRKDENGDKAPCRITKSLIESMQSPEATKTYLALCDGDGTWNGVDYLQKGWFTFDKPVKDEWGKIHSVFHHFTNPLYA